MRPEAQLFLHVLGATVLFGATGAVAVLGLVGRARGDARPLARATFRTLLVVALPAWVVTLAFGAWTDSKENLPDGLTWLDLGFHVMDGGLLLQLATAAIAFRWQRRPDTAWAGTAVGVLMSIYLVALAVAWWAMSAKVPS
jgi:hypothetical protein